MQWSRLVSGVAIAAFAISAENSVAQTSSDIKQALLNGDREGAAKQIDELAAGARSSKKVDGALDGYYGRYFAAAGDSYTAQAYLLRAIKSVNDARERDELSFELARLHEIDGLTVQAEAEYRTLGENASDAQVGRNAILSFSRMRLAEAPEEALAVLKPLVDSTSSAGERWEAHLLISRAYALLGQPEEARAILMLAWSEAPFAARPSYAIGLTAMDMAMDPSIARSERSRQGLLSTGQSEITFAGAEQLPVCGATVGFDDTVTVAVQTDEYGRAIYSAVRASRPGIAQAFLPAIALTPQAVDNAGFSVTLRCRSAPSSKARFAGGQIRGLDRWLAEQGQYPFLTSYLAGAGDPATQLKVALKTLEDQAGAKAIILVPVLLQLSRLEAFQGNYSKVSVLADARAKGERALSILSAAGAPAEVIALVRMQETSWLAQNQNLAAVNGPAAFSALEALSAEPTTSPAQVYAFFSEVSDWPMSPAQKLTLVDSVIGFLDSKKEGREGPLRQTIELRRAEILREIGDLDGLEDRLRSNGISEHLCVSAEQMPSIPPAAITITSEDYPDDLVHSNIGGLTAEEMTIDENGRVQRQRVIVSQPPGMFDPVTTKKLKNVVFYPAVTSGRASTCQGFVQKVVWRLRDDFRHGALDEASF